VRLINEALYLINESALADKLTTDNYYHV